MKHRSDLGETVRELVEAAFENSLAGAQCPAEPRASAGIVVGEVLDTHHPHLPGRVLVRFLEQSEGEVERWLQRERHLSLKKGDRVLLAFPEGYGQWVVTGALGREAREPEAEAEHARELKLGPGESVRLVSHDGRTLATLRQGSDGPSVELGDGNVELEVARTLRLKADTIELAAGQGGIDLRTDGDTVVRARTIRLN